MLAQGVRSHYLLIRMGRSGMGDMDDRQLARRRAVDAFVARQFGIRGTVRLHRAAIGLDLLRAPANVALSPVFLLTRLGAVMLGVLRLCRAARWLGARRIFLPSDVGRRLDLELTAFLDGLVEQGLLDKPAPKAMRRAVSGYTETRNAIAEITTSAIVLILGAFMFRATTPGVISLAGPIAELRARTRAIEEFALGSGLGRVWNGLFPAEPSTAQIVMTGVGLAVAASLITTFAGLLADPLQRWSGTHRRRMMRLLDRLDRQAATPTLEREHVLARAGDIVDALMVTWRGLR
ncbi:hypothetical protein PAF17_02950 [Paracoccus sp. Z330]|uniref:MotA/TolQ/ExbB proton channel domain-containing protein n=1 Tax=Paracoccus onchidii TaxID=3017813 RepID=A0ABT4ZAT6_9RHOB|nr:DUF6635 family protein [Paracoccus onchidii]MDB6176459.1 hypothetical protein [Paracoccus onchidii]